MSEEEYRRGAGAHRQEGWLTKVDAFTHQTMQSSSRGYMHISIKKKQKIDGMHHYSLLNLFSPLSFIIEVTPMERRP